MYLHCVAKYKAQRQKKRLGEMKEKSDGSCHAELRLETSPTML